MLPLGYTVTSKVNCEAGLRTSRVAAPRWLRHFWCPACERRQAVQHQGGLRPGANPGPRLEQEEPLRSLPGARQLPSCASSPGHTWYPSSSGVALDILQSFVRRCEDTQCVIRHIPAKPHRAGRWPPRCSFRCSPRASPRRRTASLKKTPQKPRANRSSSPVRVSRAIPMPSRRCRSARSMPMRCAISARPTQLPRCARSRR